MVHVERIEWYGGPNDGLEFDAPGDPRVIWVAVHIPISWTDPTDPADPGYGFSVTGCTMQHDEEWPVREIVTFVDGVHYRKRVAVEPNIARAIRTGKLTTS